MDLYLVRHATAEEHNEDRWPDDDDRPLTKRGAKDFEKFLATLEDLPDRFGVMAPSPLLRARQTAELLLARVPAKATETWVEMRPEADPKATIRRLGGLRTKQPVAVVGHQPHVGRLLAALVTGREGGRDAEFRKGAIARLDFRADRATPGRLRWLMAP